MAIVRLVRHGRASAGWNVDPDPGLDGLGEEQALRVAERLRSEDASGEAPEIWTSPLRRCQETSVPYSSAYGVAPLIVPAVAEIPSPDGVAMADRVDWLRQAMDGCWRDLGDRYVAFRDDLVQAVRSVTRDTVIFSHFIAINAVIGACTGDDRLVIRSLDNTSVTTVEVTDGTLVLIEGGSEADTLIR